MDTLYKNIRTLRIEHGLSQEELAKKVGYKSRTTIAKIEAGKVDLSKSKILEFAKVFGISFNELVYGDAQYIEECIQVERIANGKDGLIAILKDIYGQAKMEEVSGTSGFCFYFPLSNEDALSESNFDKLYDTIKPLIKDFADLMKENRFKLHQECIDVVNMNYELNAASKRTDIDIPEGTDTSDDDAFTDF